MCESCGGWQLGAHVMQAADTRTCECLTCFVVTQQVNSMHVKRCTHVMRLASPTLSSMQGIWHCNLIHPRTFLCGLRFLWLLCGRPHSRTLRWRRGRMCDSRPSRRPACTCTVTAACSTPSCSGPCTWVHHLLLDHLLLLFFLLLSLVQSRISVVGLVGAGGAAGSLPVKRQGGAWCCVRQRTRDSRETN